MPDNDSRDKPSRDNLPATNVGALDCMKLTILRRFVQPSWIHAIDGLIERVRRGEQFGEVVQNRNWQSPPQLRALMSECLNSSDPVGLALAMIQLRHRLNRQWQGLLSSFIYPGIIVVVALVVSVAFSRVLVTAADVDGLFQIYRSSWWSNEPFPERLWVVHDLLNVGIGMGVMAGWCALIALTLVTIGPRWSVLAVVSGLPIFGRPYCWFALAEMLGRLSLFTNAGRTAYESLRAVERTYLDHAASRVAEAIGNRVDAGMPLGSALQYSILSDGLSRPALGLIDSFPDRAGAKIRETGELLESMAARRCRFLISITPVMLLLFAGTIIWNTFQSYFVVFSALASMLSSFAYNVLTISSLALTMFGVHR